ncbi:MAG: 3-dehydroquinate synthase [Crocinitomicaceae bacterium]|nr:3-dehydroquinate synthase [Crocinitomicaceae bacterium]
MKSCRKNKGIQKIGTSSDEYLTLEQIFGMQIIQANNYNVEIGNLMESSFSKLLSEYSDVKKLILVDENTQEHCLSYLITSFDELSDAEVVVLPAGEENKQLGIVGNVWEMLTEYGITRHDLLINLGGGMISDMGGFIASCYKRGFPFVNIPTSLLSMVDASIGGKTGVNLGHFKNQIGVFNNPIALYIDKSFLATLPDHEIKSGYAEMIKHGLIHNAELFDRVMEMMRTNPNEIDVQLLMDCIQVKNSVVTQDPTEKGLRKILNFGHTFGHAIEGHWMERGGMTHGHAVAIGMVMEAKLSELRRMISSQEYDKIENAIIQQYEMPSYSDTDIDAMIALMSNDKKNISETVRTCLLDTIGKCSFDHVIGNAEMKEVFRFFQKN